MRTTYWLQKTHLSPEVSFSEELGEDFTSVDPNVSLLVKHDLKHVPEPFMSYSWQLTSHSPAENPSFSFDLRQNLFTHLTNSKWISWTKLIYHEKEMAMNPRTLCTFYMESNLRETPMHNFLCVDYFCTLVTCHFFNLMSVHLLAMFMPSKKLHKSWL